MLIPGRFCIPVKMLILVLIPSAFIQLNSYIILRFTDPTTRFFPFKKKSVMALIGLIIFPPTPSCSRYNYIISGNTNIQKK